ncbi:MAG: ribonuclease Z [Candidatus Pacearchaeota archaeon]|nr:ribonuclease Z [Candidatus Pacearchaeota archaeon]
MININFLGTAAHIPTIKKNHSSILLNYKKENILIDCGEGTQRQFRHAKLNPCKITRILITHWHLDHILGIPGLLSTLALSGYNKTLYIYGPSGTKEKINSLFKTLNFHKEYQIITEEAKGKFLNTKEFYIQAEPMQHKVPCNAYTFVKKEQIRINKEKLKKSKLPKGPILKKLKEGKDIIYKEKKYKAKDLTYTEPQKKITIIMDTLDNKKIISFSKNSDILISEATFTQELKDQAKEHKHLTTTQAAQNAKKSKSKKLILTHISQRYENKTKEVLKEAQDIFKETILAKDLDEISL